MTTAIDLDFVRAQFPAFAEPSLQGQAFFENAGGSYACAPVIARLTEYYRRLKLQPYYPTAASTEAGEWMDASYARLAEYLGVPADWLHLGPSTSQNSYVLAQAFGKWLQAGDEIIVTDQDHEANSGVWRRLAALGVKVREWQVDPDSGALHPEQLWPLLNERTRLVAFTHCSNIVGAINPVAAITARLRAAGVLSVVDGVSYAPHGFPELGSLGADIYLFSLYKTFGPHLGLMALNPALVQRLPNEGHFFNEGVLRKRLLPAGPDHAQIAAARGIAEYFDALDAHHHAGATLSSRPGRVRQLLRGAELALLEQLLDYLAQRKNLRLIGPSVAGERAATVSFVPLKQEPDALVRALAARGVMAASGHFYALRLLQALGLDPARGVVRLSFVHYTSAADLQQLLRALDAVLSVD